MLFVCTDWLVQKWAASTSQLQAAEENLCFWNCACEIVLTVSTYFISELLSNGFSHQANDCCLLLSNLDHTFKAVNVIFEVVLQFKYGRVHIKD